MARTRTSVRWKISIHADIGNQEVIFKHAAIEILPHYDAQGGTGTITGDQPVGFDLVGAFGGCDIKRDMGAMIHHAIDAIFSPNLNWCAIRLGGDNRFMQELFKIRLWQVDEGGVFMAAKHGMACASMIITDSSPMITPELGSPSAVKTQRPSPISIKAISFSVRSPCDAKALAMVVPSRQGHFRPGVPSNFFSSDVQQSM